MTFAIEQPADQWDGSETASQRWRREWDERATACIVPLALTQGFVLTHAQCDELGFSLAQRRTLVRRGLWSVPRRGVLAVVHPQGDATVAAALAATAAALIRPDSVVSHDSAAILHGLPVLHTPRGPMLTIQAGFNGAVNGTRLFRATLEVAQTSDWYGCAVTTVARTVTDAARRHRDSGLITADAGLHDDVVSLAELHQAIRISTGWPGNAAARWVVDHADGRAESPLESLTRACVISAGLPTPDLQVWIPAAKARVDLIYRAERVVIEADGMVKYRSPADLREEKVRQERLERAGYHVIRVLWGDLHDDLSATIQRIARALQRRT